MRVYDVCTHHAVSIDPNATVQQAARLMRERHVGTVVAVEKPDGERLPVGILTDRDVAVAVVALGIDAAGVRVADVMTGKVVTCTVDEDIFDAIARMRHHGIRRLPVLNAKGGLFGMVAADDIYGALGAYLQDLSRAATFEQVQEMELRT